MPVSSIINSGGFYFAAFITAAMVLLFSFVKYKNARPQNRIFHLFLYIILISAAALIMRIFGGAYMNTSSAARNMYFTGHYIYFIVHSLLAPVFCIYLFIVAQAVDLSINPKLLFLILPSVFMEAAIIVNPFFHLVYYYDQNDSLHRNTGETVLYILSAVYFIAAVITIFNHWSGINRQRRIALIYCIILTITGVLIQLIYPKIKVELFAEAIASIGLLLVVENDGDWTDIMTGLFNRNALIIDMGYYLRKKKTGYVLCMRLINSQTRLRGFVMSAAAQAIRSLKLGYDCYRMTPTALLFNLRDRDEDATIALAESIYRIIEKGFEIQNTHVQCDVNVIWAKYPDEIPGLNEIFLMGETELPSGVSGNDYTGAGLQAIIRKANVEEALHRGLVENEFEVFYQPVHTGGDHRLYSAEALIRLHDSVIGEVFPDEFIPLAEQNGLINDIGLFVLREVCQFIKSGVPAQLGMNHINVNLSVVQCLKKSFVNDLKSVVAEYGVDPSMINFEITESVAANDYSMLDRIIREFKAAGFEFSMDDYGTGYSNMESIFLLDFNVIKIDKSILWDSENNQKGRIILENSIRMIRRMKKKVLVEGVETDAQVALLDELGADYLQGYHFSRPVSKKDFIALYEDS